VAAGYAKVLMATVYDDVRNAAENAMRAKETGVP
jgi:hypothetical protein